MLKVIWVVYTASGLGKSVSLSIIMGEGFFMIGGKVGVSWMLGLVFCRGVGGGRKRKEKNSGKTRGMRVEKWNISFSCFPHQHPPHKMSQTTSHSIPSFHVPTPTPSIPPRDMFCWVGIFDEMRGGFKRKGKGLYGQRFLKWMGGLLSWVWVSKEEKQSGKSG